MDRATLREQWAEHNDRPVWVREHREAIHEHTDTADPIPDGSTYQVRQWLDRFKSTVTRQLNSDDGETPTDADTEEGA